MEVRRYLTTGGRNVFSEWLAELADRSAKARIADRIDRLREEILEIRASIGDRVIGFTMR